MQEPPLTYFFMEGFWLFLEFMRVGIFWTCIAGLVLLALVWAYKVLGAAIWAKATLRFVPDNQPGSPRSVRVSMSYPTVPVERITESDPHEVIPVYLFNKSTDNTLLYRIKFTDQGGCVVKVVMGRIQFERMLQSIGEVLMYPNRDVVHSIGFIKIIKGDTDYCTQQVLLQGNFVQFGRQGMSKILVADVLRLMQEHLHPQYLLAMKQWQVEALRTSTVV
jgi:hypothetical protein